MRRLTPDAGRLTRLAVVVCCGSAVSGWLVVLAFSVVRLASGVQRGAA